MGGGASFYTNSYQQEALDQIMLPLLAAGYQLAEIRWPDLWFKGVTDGDFTTPAEAEDWEGQAALACRVAAMVRWVWDNKHPQGQGLSFCGTGNSGGASQLAYTLTHYGMESLWDAVVLTSGPTHSDIAHGCWATCSLPIDGCYSGTAKCGVDWAYGNPEADCKAQSNSYGPCQDPAGHAPAQSTFDFQSIAVDPTARWDYFYDSTVVWFLKGELDLTSAIWQQARYFDELVASGTAIGNSGTIFEVTGAGHKVPADDQGAGDVHLALTTSCLP